MAINFLALPALKNPDPIDWEPLGKGFDAIREGNKDNRLLDIKQQGQDLDRSKFGLQERQFGAQEQQRKVEMLGNQAMAALNLEGPAREAAHARLLSQHPNPGSLSPEYRDPKIGVQLMAADFGKYRDQLAEKEKNARIGLMHAQTEKERAHGRSYDELGKARAGTGMVNPPVDPMVNIGLGPNGEVVPVRQQEQYLAGGSSGGSGDVSRENTQYGHYGQRPADVPGVVVNPQGGSDRLATMASQGQRAMDSVEQTARNKLLSAQRNQQIYTSLYGKAPSGKVYDENGKLVDLSRKESVTDRQSLALATQGLQTLDQAEKILTGGRDEKTKQPRGGSTYLTQYTGDTYDLPGVGKVGGFGEAGRGFKSAEMSIVDLNFAISGKSVSNAERVEFQRLYVPRATDSLETQQWKIDQARSFFRNAIKARSTGATDDDIAGLYRSSILEALKRDPGAKKTAPAGASGSDRTANPAQDRIKNKYGLE